MDRRQLLIGLGALIAAPAIVRASSLMPVRSYVPIVWGDGIHDDTEALKDFHDFKPYRLASSFRGTLYRSNNLILIKDADFLLPQGFDYTGVSGIGYVYHEMHDIVIRNRSKLSPPLSNECWEGWQGSVAIISE